MTTPQHHYESIREKLNKAIPERTELKFGCEVEYQNARKVEKYVYLYKIEGFGDVLCPLENFGQSTGVLNITNPRFNKILGTPITLAEILRGIEKQYPDYQYAIGTDGHILVFKKSFETGEMVFEGSGIYLDLTKPVSEQSLETLKRIDELL